MNNLWAGDGSRRLCGRTDVGMQIAVSPCHNI